MSDQFGPTNGDEETGATTPPPPPPPPPQAPVEAPLTLDTETAVTRSSGLGGRALAGLVGVLLLVGGTAFAVTQLGSSGPESPEAAVDELLAAASDEDVLGLLAALDPGERDSLRGPVEDLFGELERLQVLDDSFELTGVDGVDLEFTDVTYRAEPVREGLTRVYLTGGTVTTSVDSDELPIGAFVRDTVDRFGGEITGFQQSETNDLLDDGDDEVFLVAHDGEDGWRVSIGYTIAELYRLDVLEPLPTDPVDPIGAESPEAAVEGLIEAAADLDPRGVIARLSPNEFAALQEYASLVIGPGADIDDDAEVQIDVEEVRLRSETSGDRGTVFVDGFAFSAEIDGDSFRLSYLDGCLDVEGDALDEFFFAFDPDESPFEDGPLCGDDLTSLGGDGFGLGTGPSGEDPFADLGLDELASPEIGITTQRVDGGWYAAPVETGLDAVVAGLRVLERSHLDAMVDVFESFVTGFEESFEEFEDYDDYEDYDYEYDDDSGVDYEEGAGEEADPGLPPPTPTSIVDTTLGGTGSVDQQALEELVSFVADDDAVADCMLKQLAVADEALVAEIADSWVHDYEPSVEAQDTFYAAYDSCL